MSATTKGLTSEELTASMTEEEKQAEYYRMIASGLSEYEARGMLWQEKALSALTEKEAKP